MIIRFIFLFCLGIFGTILHLGPSFTLICPDLSLPVLTGAQATAIACCSREEFAVDGPSGAGRRQLPQQDDLPGSAGGRGMKKTTLDF